MIAPAFLLITAALSGADADTGTGTEVGISVPAGVLAPVPATAAPQTVASAPAPIGAYVPPPSPPELLVGREAWLDQKYMVDPLIGTDHGRPTVIFEVNDPVLRPTSRP